MADNPFSADRLPLDNPFGDSGPRDPIAEYAASQSSHGQETRGSGYAEGYDPQFHHAGQPGWGLTSRQMAATYLPQTSANRRDWGLITSPTAGGDRRQTSTNQGSPTPLGQVSASQQPNSVKHLTCWYWANKGCRLPDHACLYSHHDTGRIAEPPVQVQPGREFSSHYPSFHFECSFHTCITLEKSKSR